MADDESRAARATRGGEDGVARSDDSLLLDISVAAEEAQRARDRVEQAVAAARQAGRSWAQIGASLGISRQAAWERFNSPRHG